MKTVNFNTQTAGYRNTENLNNKLDDTNVKSIEIVDRLIKRTRIVILILLTLQHQYPTVVNSLYCNNQFNHHFINIYLKITFRSIDVNLAKAANAKFKSHCVHVR